MLTPEYLLRISDGAEQIAAKLHTDIIKRISRRILARKKRGADYLLTAVDKWHIEALMQSGYLRTEIEEDIARANNLQQQEVKEAFEDAGVKSTDYDDKIYRAAGIETTDFRQSPHMMRLMQREYEATMGEWRNATRTTADATQEAFINAMDMAYHNVMTGNIGYVQAFIEAIDGIASEGLKVTYPTGHVDTLETAALRCVRTGISQASAQIQIARMDEFGVDLVLVSSHVGARPEHQIWQGLVYSRSGQSKKYPDFVSSTGYGTGEGLCGWNCRHNFSPYFEGMINPFERYNDEENVKKYEDTQKQRAMERAIRKTKRRQQVMQDSIDNAPDQQTADAAKERLKSINALLHKQNERYYAFCEEKDLRPLRERLRIAKANRSVSRVYETTNEV